VKLADPSAAGNGSASEEHEIPAVAAPREPAAGPGKRPFKSKTSRIENAASIFIGAGRADGVRPGDLVGLIAKVAKIPPADIGSIQITERFSLVEVPDPVAEEVIRSIRTSGVRGNKVTVRRDRDR
jgi:ATP-dependent RNA helicase DeaD